MKTKRQQRETIKAERQAAEWNKAHEVGTSVTYWPGIREGAGDVSRTRTKAQLLGGHTAVVWIEARPDCIALSHIEAAGGAKE